MTERDGQEAHPGTFPTLSPELRHRASASGSERMDDVSGQAEHEVVPGHGDMAPLCSDCALPFTHLRGIWASHLPLSPRFLIPG